MKTATLARIALMSLLVTGCNLEASDGTAYGRIASYTFDDTLDDALGRHATGTLTGEKVDVQAEEGKSATYAAGKNGDALSLDGTYGIRLPNDLINSASYTVSFWLNSHEMTQFTPTFFGAASNSSWVSLTPMSWDTSKTMLWSGSQSWYDGNFGHLLDTGTWYHIAFSVDQGMVNIYQDGEPAHSGSGFPDVFSNGTELFSLGVNWWDPAYNGQIDELRIYNRALVADEIIALDIDNLSENQIAERTYEQLSPGDVSQVTHNLDLSTVGLFGTTVTWTSSNPAVIAADGTVTRPAVGEQDQQVVLTASYTFQGHHYTKSFVATVLAQQPVITYNPIPLNQVRLTSGPFYDAEMTNLHYILGLDPDRFLAPYRREAGLPMNGTPYPSWESEGLDGHIGGHYLTALSLMYASLPDSHPQKQVVLDRLNYMITELQKVQVANGDGYIGGIPNAKTHWQDLAAGNINAQTFYLNDMWVPWYNLHKVYAGLRDAYLYTGNDTALQLLQGLSNWAMNITANLSDAQIQTILTTEQGGMNEVLADVAELTHEDKYLNLAKRFSHKAILDPLLQHQDQLTGIHANTQIPKVIGYARIGKLADDNDWLNAAKFFWDVVVHQRSVSIGGNSVQEYFNDKNDFTSMITSEQGPESCNTYNMLKLTRSLYQDEGSLAYIDYYERALYNHILSTQHPNDGGLVYFTPMRPNHYRVYSSNSPGKEAMWCCVGSGIESHSKYGAMIYAEANNEFYVNLFVDSTVQWKNGIGFTQSTAFPDEESSALTVNGAGNFAINIRYPGWVTEGALTLSINGQPQTVSSHPDQYIRLQRNWQDGDVIRWTMPMTTTVEQLPDGSDYYSILHGPIVLANAGNPFPNEQLEFIAGSGRSDHIPSGERCPLYDAPIFIGQGADFLSKIKPVTGIPLTFTTGDAELNLDQPITLVPFFRLHDTRYSVYFNEVTQEEWDETEAELIRQEEERAALEAITLDQLQPGQQQPESDHYLQSQNSNTGTHQSRYWRDATDGFFSYQMDPQGETAVQVMVTYWGGDTNRTFNILVNDNVIAQVTLAAAHPDEFFDVKYDVPAGLITGNNPVRVKFESVNGSIAGGIFYLRLIRVE